MMTQELNKPQRNKQNYEDITPATQKGVVQND